METDKYDTYPAFKFLCPETKRQRKRRERAIREVLSGNRAWWKRYHRYIQSPAWAAFRERVFQERGVNCERCGVSGSVRRTQVHHVEYSRLGHELPEDVKVLCGPCHQLMHPNRSLSFRGAR